MTTEQARKILHPDTTREAIAETERDGGSGIAAVEEACLIACGALEKQIPKKPYNRVKLGEKTVIGTCPECGGGNNSEYPYCGKCGQALNWMEDDAQED